MNHSLPRSFARSQTDRACRRPVSGWWQGAGLCVALLCGLPQAYAGTTQDTLVEKGRYLSIAADCGGCHTMDPDQPYAGGKPLESPFGTLYTTNITPDPDTGIGGWTQDDFTRSMRNGLNEHDEYVYPAMPYVNYTKIKDADIDALWAYLQSLQPVNARPPEHDLVFPTNIRDGLGLWQELYFEPGRFRPAADKSAEYNRGAYLVEALGHCSACHSPRDILMGQKEGAQHLGGAEVQQWYAPDISGGPLSATSKWSVEQLATFLKTGTNDTNVTAFGEMARIIEMSLSRLNDTDLRAMAVYLKNQPAPAEAPETPTPNAMPPARFAAGRAIYSQHCLNCHQPGGKGLKGAAPALTGNTAITGAQPDNAIAAVLQGFPADDLWGAMPSFAGELSDIAIADVVNYVRTAWRNNSAASANPDMVRETRAEADIPAYARRATLVCPNLPVEQMKPALATRPPALKAALDDRERLKALVRQYAEARPRAPVSDVVEALTTAYCRAVVSEDISEAELNGRIADFSGQVAGQAVRQNAVN